MAEHGVVVPVVDMGLAWKKITGELHVLYESERGISPQPFFRGVQLVPDRVSSVAVVAPRDVHPVKPNRLETIPEFGPEDEVLIDRGTDCHEAFNGIAPWGTRVEAFEKPKKAYYRTFAMSYQIDAGLGVVGISFVKNVVEAEKNLPPGASKLRHELYVPQEIVQEPLQIELELTCPFRECEQPLHDIDRLNGLGENAFDRPSIRR